MIIYKEVEVSELKSDFLKGFDRYQETQQVLFLDKGVLKQKADFFLEYWDEKRLNQITAKLRECALIGGKVFSAIQDGSVIGFACVESNIFFEEYVNMPYIHVSKDFRGMGIGKKLFNLVKEAARGFGAEKLYISAHPNIETQKFYQNIGCVLARKVNPILYQLEPLDIQLEYQL